MSQGQEKLGVPFQRKGNSAFCHRCAPSGWIQMSGSDDAHHVGEGRSSSLGLPVQMTVSSINALADTRRSSVLPAVRAPHSPDKLAHNMSYHRGFVNMVRDSEGSAQQIGREPRQRSRQDQKGSNGNSCGRSCLK